MNVKRILAGITCFVLVFGSIGFERVVLAQEITPTAEPTATVTPEFTATPTPEPTATPTPEPTATPTAEPTATPTAEPTATPTAEPTATPTAEPTSTSTANPTATASAEPTTTPTAEPTATPVAEPSAPPTAEPTATPTAEPTTTSTAEPTVPPTHAQLAVDIALDHESVVNGSPITASWIVDGGTEPYAVDFIWQINRSSQEPEYIMGTVYDAVSSSVCDQTFGTDGIFTLNVSDSSGIIGNATKAFTIERPINPIQFSHSVIERTVHYNAGNNGGWVVSVNITSDISSLGGTPEWSLSTISGDSVENLQITNRENNVCNVGYDAVLRPGDTTCDLIYTIGEYSASIPVTIKVSNATVPTSMATGSPYVGVAGTPIHISRRILLPEGTDISPDLFNFSLNVMTSDPGWQKSGDSEQGYDVTFSTPGYYSADMIMSYADLSFFQTVAINITDEYGNVPNPIQFNKSSLDATVYIDWSTAGRFLGNVSVTSPNWTTFEEGTFEWSIRNVTGSSVDNFSIYSPEIHTPHISCSNLLEVGDTSCELVFTLGEFSAYIPVTVHVMGGTVPKTIAAIAPYRGTTGVPIHVDRPALLPEGTDLSPDSFHFNIDGRFAYGGEMSGYTNKIVGNSDYGYDVTLGEPGLYYAQVQLSYADIGLTQEILFIVADEGGTVPNPINFNWSAIDRTVYINGSNLGSWQDYVTITGNMDLISGTPLWSLSPVSGNSVENLRIISTHDSMCTVGYGSVLSAGETAATLTCDWGEYSKSIPMRINVSNDTIPTSMATGSPFEGVAGTAIHVARPTLLPEGTDLSAELFDFTLSSAWIGDNITGDSVNGHEVTFYQPGYYNAYARMYYDGITIGETVIFAVADADGNIPSPIHLSQDSIEVTRYINWNAGGGNVGNVSLYSDVSMPGTPVWSLTDIMGGTVENVRVETYEWNTGYCNIRYDALVGAGDTTATLTCTVGTYSASIPVTITVSGDTIPTSMEMPTSYSGTAGTPIHVARPTLLPAGTTLSPDLFSFSLGNPPYETTGNSAEGYDVTFHDPGYYRGYASMSFGDILFNQTIVFAVADAEGNLPNPIHLSQSALEVTRYIDWSAGGGYVGNISLYSDVSMLGTPAWSLTDIAGGSVENLRIVAYGWNNGYCDIYYDALAGAGDTTATLTCTVGTYSASISVTIHVSDDTIPTSMETASLYSGTAGTPIHVARPTLLPAGTDMLPDLFNFSLNAYYMDSQMTGTSEAGYDVTFQNPGYYTANAYMSYGEISFNQTVMFAVADTNGIVPGNPFQLSPSAINKTIYFNSGSLGGWSSSVYVMGDVSALGGTPVWSLSSVTGDSVGNLHVNNNPMMGGNYCNVGYDAVLRVGITTAEVVCTVGAYSAKISVTITVSGETIPTSMETASPYSGTAGTPIHVARPTLLPAGTDMSPDLFYFGLGVYYMESQMIGTSEVGYDVTFQNPGYYTANAYMSYGEISFNQTVMFAVADTNGTVPGNAFQLSPSAINRTVYYNAGNLGGGGSSVYIMSDISALGGTPVWSLESITGNSVGNLHVSALPMMENYWRVDYDAVLRVGITTAEVVCTVGAYSARIPVTITVSGDTVPTSMETASPYIGKAGTPIHVARPMLLPSGTDLSPDNYYFNINGNFAQINGSSIDGYDIVFNVPGYYSANAYMYFADMWFDQGITFIVADENGNVPNPIQLSQSALDVTRYIDWSAGGGEAGNVSLYSDVSMLGTLSWSLTDIAGSSVENLRVEKNNWDLGTARIVYDALLSAGDTTATLTCTVGTYSTPVPVTIHVLGETVPKSIAVVDPYIGRIGTPIHIARPVLLPEGTSLSPNLYEFWLSGNIPGGFGVPGEFGGNSVDGYDITFNAPGYYIASVYMSYTSVDDMSLRRNIVIIVADSNGVLPPLVPVAEIQLSNDSLLIDRGEQTWLYAVSVIPQDATVQSISWASDNEAVATVNQNGMVTGVGTGSTVITATTMDGSGISASCAVTVPDSFVVSLDMPSTVVAGSEIIASWEITGGVGPYSINYTYWTIEESNGSLIYDSGETIESTSTLKPLFGDIGHIYIGVSDQSGKMTEFSKEFTITGSADPISVEISMSGSAVVGNQITASWVITGGGDPYINAAYWIFQGTDSDYGESVDEAVIVGNSSAFTPLFGTKGWFSISIRDTFGRQRSFSQEFSITGSSDPISATITLLETVEVGSPIASSWVITGGVEPYVESAKWIVFEGWGRPSGEHDAVLDGNNAVFTPLYGTRGSLQIKVIDNVGRSKYFSQDFIINGSPPNPILVTITMPYTVEAGTPITASWVITGGADPYIDHATWDIYLGPNNTTKFAADVVGDTSTFTPIIGSMGHFVITVMDSLGRNMSFDQPFSITSSQPVTEITLNQTEVTMNAGSTYHLTAAVLPANASDPSLAWVSDDTSIVTVGEGGLMTAVSYGVATVTAHALDGSNVQAACTVTVLDPFSASLTMQSGSVVTGSTVTASWNITGGDALYTTRNAQWWVTNDAGLERTYPAQINGNSSSFSPMFGKRGQFSATIVDAQNREKYLFGSFIITGEPVALAIENLSISEPVVAGSLATASWTVSGAVEPLTLEVSKWTITEADGTVYSYTTTVSNNSSSLTPRFGAIGQYSLQLKNSLGRRVSANKTFTITGSPDPLPATLNFVYPGSTPQAGTTPIAVSWTNPIGAAPVSCKWIIGNIDGITSTTYTTAYAAIGSSFIPPDGIGYQLSVKMADSLGRWKVYTSENRTMIPAVDLNPIMGSYVVEPATVETGKIIKATLALSGGTSPFISKVTWYIKDAAGNLLRTFLDDELNGVANFAPQFGTSGYVEATVFDAVGRQKMIRSADFTITEPEVMLDPLGLTLQLNPAAPKPGEQVQAQWEVSGGKVPYTVTAVTTCDTQQISSSTYTMQGGVDFDLFTPSFDGEWVFEVTVRDAAGQEMTVSNPFTIKSEEPVGIIEGTFSLEPPTVTVGSQVIATLTLANAVLPQIQSAKVTVQDSLMNQYIYDATVTQDGPLDFTISFTPQFGIVGQFDVKVVDALGRVALFTEEFGIVGYVAPETPLNVSSLSISNSDIVIGEANNESVTANWTISGGDAPYQVLSAQWLISETNGSDQSVDAVVLGENGIYQSTYAPLFGSNGIFKLTIGDTKGRTASAQSQPFYITGAEPLDPITASINLVPPPPVQMFARSLRVMSTSAIAIQTEVIAGQTYTATWTILGGRPPYQVKAYWLTDISTGNELPVAQGENLISCQYTPRDGIKGKLRLDITDAAGREGSIFSSQVKIVHLVTGITLNSSTLTMNPNDVYALLATVTPVGASNKKVTWISSNEAVVTFSEAGELRALKGGKAYITVTAVDKYLVYATCEVTVREPVTGISINQMLITLNVDGTQTLTPTVNPSTATIKTVSWASSNTDVVTVGTNGRLTAIARGKAIITATAQDGSGKKADCQITVKTDASTLVFNAIPVQTYSGNAIEPTITVRDGDRVLVHGTDFTVSYASNVTAGIATATIMGIGDYSGTQTLNFTISKAAGAITGITKMSKVYDGTSVLDPECTITGNGNVTITYYVTTIAGNEEAQALLGEAPTDAGSYTAKVTLAEGSNHTGAESSMAFTISKAIYDMSGAKWDYTTSFIYDGNAKIVKVVGLPTGLIVISYSGNTATNANTFTAGVLLDYDTVNYELPTIDDLQWTIDPKVVGLEWSGYATRAYDGYASTVTAAATGLVNEDSCSVTVTGGDAVNAGTHLATVTGTSNANYIVPATGFEQVYSISKASYNMVGAGWNYTGAFTYDGNMKTVEIISLPDGVSVASYLGNTGTNPGTYSGTVILAYDIQNYEEPLVAKLGWGITLPSPTITTIEAISSTSLKIYWDSVPGATGYILERATSIDGAYSTLYTGPSMTFTNTKLKAGTVYYRVRATMVLMDTLYFSIPSSSVPGVILAAPTISRTELLNANQVMIIWDTIGDATGYQLWRSTSQTGIYTKIYEGEATSHTDNTKTPGISYYYKVCAYMTYEGGCLYGLFSKVIKQK